MMGTVTVSVCYGTKAVPFTSKVSKDLFCDLSFSLLDNTGVRHLDC